MFIQEHYGSYFTHAVSLKVQLSDIISQIRIILKLHFHNVCCSGHL